jgi:DNA-binding GntR family transcriptional regulator
MIIFMSRPRSEKVEIIKEKIRTRLREGVHRPGDRFLSTRAVASTFEVSYQTAHRLIGELCEEGWLERRAASGTFIAGQSPAPVGVQLFWSARARRKGSFGARLLSDLTRRLNRDRIVWKIAWTDTAFKLHPKYFPLVWKCRRFWKSAWSTNAARYY